jgi:hypothetical protein
MDERPAVRGIWIFSIIWLGRLVSFLGSSLTGFALRIYHRIRANALKFLGKQHLTAEVSNFSISPGNFKTKP